MVHIVAIQLQKVSERLAERHIRLKWEETAAHWLAKEGYDPSYGARPLKRLIQQTVVQPLSQGILEGKIPANGTVAIYVDGNKLAYQVKL